MEPPGGGLWTMEDLDLLASDLDSSLSGLGGAGTTTFDMSDTLSAIQVIKMNKEDDVLIREQWLRHLSFPDKGLDKVKARSAQNLSTWNFSKSSDRPNSKKPCRAHQEDSLENEEKIRESNGEASILHAPTLCNSLSQYSLQPGFISKAKTDFQYVLAAATSLGTKIGAETLTYLNQGQPYEIRLMKMHGISEMKGKLLKTRFKFGEKMELMAWQSQRPSERILDIDVSLSYGIFDVIPDPENINSCEFIPQHFPDIKDTLEGMFSPESDDSGILTPNTGVENITANLSTTDVHSWLSRKKFSKYLPCFELYSAKDLLSLSREDIIEICGPSDGIRLYNSLHRREPPPVRRLYISRDNMTFHALYLHSVTCYELQTELCRIYHFPDGAIAEMYITGPNGILLVLTDRVLQNLKDESTFTCEILKAEENGKNTVILRAYIPNQET
ncbi:Transcription factor CP2 like protein [Argiope bruennichi]|uniref:Transcription factor CP2 like protein n=1 Tax=Argiope bruennichi TaxID=94029 RepID=A0A8T0FFP9_ARGBR|nr:Transcription factor CP2 like protein [Argiope bruennichi]